MISKDSDELLRANKRLRTSNPLSPTQFGLLLLLPLFVVLAAVSLYPLFYSVWASFQDFRLSRPNAIEFTGLSNYLEVFRDEDFFRALTNSLTYTLVAVPLELVLGLGIAMALGKIGRGRDLARALIVIPMMLAPIVMGLMWKFMYSDQLGVINFALRGLGITQGTVGWLTDTNLALGSLIFVEIWATTPFMVILLSAGLTTIPAELYEAARMDGATSWQRFTRITLPMLRPIILVALLIRGMDAFRVFDLVYTLTQGGPAGSTDVLSYYLYRLTFTQLDVGMASAGSFVMLSALIGMGLLLIRSLRRAEA